MKLIINKDRSVIQIGTWGTKNENDFEIVDFEFPEELEGYNKRIVYLLGGGDNPWDVIIDNKAYITNEITSKENVKGYVLCTKENPDRPADTDFRSREFDMPFYENEPATGLVPTPVQVDGFNTMLTAMNAKIDEVDALETTIETAEAERQEAEATRVSNENTRESNESTRQTNEQTRQTQEAERERRTDEAIADIEDKTAEYNANAEAKTTAFNQNATQKTNEFNSNYTQKVNDFNANATTQKTEFNTNASSKTSAFNSNAETKTNTFNTNATNKTNAFNSNASEKTTAFDNNASTKTSEFNTNAESKTSAFNDNATQKTTNFDNNASEKTDEFNTNAQEKIDEYDEHIVEYQAQIDELQEEVEELSENMPWNTTEQVTEIQVTDAAKYSRNKLELFGNTEQTQYTGKNLFNVSDSSFEWGTLTFKLIDNIIKITIGDGNGGISQNPQGTYTNYNFNINQNYYFSVYPKKGDLLFKEDAPYKFFRIVIYIKYDDDTVSNDSLSITSNMTQKSVKVSFTPGKTPIAFAIGRYSPSGSLKNNQEAEYYVQLEEGEATDYEPYVGGAPSPSPDYPQPIHVVTGNNTIVIQGKNLIDYSALNKYNRDLSGAPSVGSPLRYYNNSKALQFNVSVSNFVGKNIFFSFDFSHTNFRRFALDTNGNYIETFSNGGLIKENYSYITILINSNVDIPTSTDIKFMAEQGSTATSYVPYYHTDYPINLGSLELCKIGNYQDYLYKENGNWYKYGAINKVILDGTTETWGGVSTSNNFKRIDLRNTGLLNEGSSRKTNLFCSISRASTVEDYNIAFNYNNVIFFYLPQGITTYNEWKALLSQKMPKLYYILATPTITQITDETLISQLDAIYEHLQLVKGTNNITVTASDLAPYMKLSYMQDLKSKLDNLDSRLALLE